MEGILNFLRTVIIFMQDNDPKHNSIAAKAFLEANGVGMS